MQVRNKLMFQLQDVHIRFGLPGTVSKPAWVSGVATDTRQLQPGDLFVALQGQRDGHEFLAAAAAAGAAAALVQRYQPDLALPQWVVPDPLTVLGELAAAWRRQFDLPVLALTGSSGKTTVKELLAASLAATGLPVLATTGNLNNHIGVPLTLLRLRAEHRYAVIELGANHPGEIAALVRLVQPDVALVNNAGPAHLAGFGSLDGVARAKAEIYAGLKPGGVAVINADDAYAPLWLAQTTSWRQVRFGLEAEAEVRGRALAGQLTEAGLGHTAQVDTPEGTFVLQLALGGLHNVRNALAATAMAWAVGVPLDAIAQGLASVRPVRGRLAGQRLADGGWLIDDTYNANPASVRAAIAVLASLPGPRWLVLGDLGELGPEAVQLHQDLGQAARAAGLERLLTVGPLSAAAAAAFGAGGEAHATQAALIACLQARREPVTLLVKGSRSAKMENIVQALLPRSVC